MTTHLNAYLLLRAAGDHTACFSTASACNDCVRVVLGMYSSLQGSNRPLVHCRRPLGDERLNVHTTLVLLRPIELHRAVNC